MKKSYCLDSVSSSQQISSSPLNRSSSKNLWSFAKDSRFKSPKPYCDSIYQIPSTFKKKGTSMGYGRKSDFTKDLTASPSASKYHMKTIFDRNRETKTGFSMYVSREVSIAQQKKIPSRGHIPLAPLKVPAANKYDNMKVDQGRRYSMRPKTRTIDVTMSIQSQNRNPGAGTYENPEQLSPRGKYSISKHKGTGATLFSPRSSKRFFQFSKYSITSENENPGPGRYKDVNALSNKGQYTLSKSTGYGKRVFDKQRRIVEFEKKALKNYFPGPGSYRSPSQFGHYDGDIILHQTLNNTSSSRMKNTYRKTDRR